jgi:hypothetical protein
VLAAVALLLGRLLDMTEPSDADRSPAAEAALANWRRLRDAGRAGSGSSTGASTAAV